MLYYKKLLLTVSISIVLQKLHAYSNKDYNEQELLSIIKSKQRVIF